MCDMSPGDAMFAPTIQWWPAAFCIGPGTNVSSGIWTHYPWDNPFSKCLFIFYYRVPILETRMSRWPPPPKPGVARFRRRKPHVDTMCRTGEDPTLPNMAPLCWCLAIWPHPEHWYPWPAPARAHPSHKWQVCLCLQWLQFFMNPIEFFLEYSGILLLIRDGFYWEFFSFFFPYPQTWVV
jgi:hypothetical protein